MLAISRQRARASLDVTVPIGTSLTSIVHWTENGWAISDLAASKLEDLAQLFRATPRGIVKGGMKRKSPL